jgi:hypothetical protein
MTVRRLQQRFHTNYGTRPHTASRFARKCATTAAAQYDGTLDTEYHVREVQKEAVMNLDQNADPVSVLVIGEALIDAVNRDGNTTEHPGGSPANVALGLSRLGVATSLLTKIGNDPRGNAITSHLQEASVLIDPASAGPEPTSLATATIEADGSAHYDFDLHWSFNAPETPTRHQLLHTGSVASFHPRGSKELLAYVEAKAEESLVTYDPNIRPALLICKKVCQVAVVSGSHLYGWGPPVGVPSGCGGRAG